MKENETVTLDLDIEVLDQREELLVAAAGCTTTNHRSTSIQVVTIED